MIDVKREKGKERKFKPKEEASRSKPHSKEVETAGVLVGLEKEIPEEKGVKEYEAFKNSLDRDKRERYERTFRAGVSFVIQTHEKKFDTLVFTDKSARPLASLFSAIWKRVYPNEKPPARKFLIPGEATQKRVSEATQKFAPSRRDFEGKHVLLVDEETSSGGALLRGREILLRAFKDKPPTIKFGIGEPPLTFIENSVRKDIEVSVSGFGWLGGSGVGNYIEETDGAFVKVRKDRKRSMKESKMHELYQVGKYEIISPSRLDWIKYEIKTADDAKKRIYLQKLHEVYLSLLSPG